MKLRFFTSAPHQTKKAGEILAKEILNTALGKKALVLALVGDLGGGKTTFIQGLARGLGIKEKILSPTFIIMRKFLISHNLPLRTVQFLNFYHLDCYRIEKAKDVLDLGFKEIVSDPQNIVAIEWADRIKKIIPRGTIWVNFEFVDKNKRKIVVESKNGR